MNKFNLSLWLKNRNLEERPYQEKVINSIFIKILDKPTILASCPGSGKTLMSIAFIERYLKANPNAKVLVLTHGTNILKNQYLKNVNKYNVDFSFSTKLNTAKVTITLPQSIRNKDLSHYDLIVVDEAHQFYLSPSVQRILDKCRPKHQLLLTATPSKFINNIDKYNIVPIDLLTLFKLGYVRDVTIKLAKTSYDYNIENYNSTQDLRKDTKLNKKDTYSTLDNLLSDIINRLNISDESKWNDALVNINKTMIVCASQKQALDVSSYFNKNKINNSLSTSKIDINSKNIDNFINNEKCLVLIVVNRGILGFDYAPLMNVIDLSGTSNIDKLFQLYTRLVRPYEGDKFFYKIVPEKMYEYFRYVLSAMMHLSHEKWLLKHSSNTNMNFNIVKPTIKFEKDKKISSKKPNISIFGEFTLDFFNKVINNDSQFIKNTVQTNLSEVKNKLFGSNAPYGHWQIFKNHIPVVSEYSTISEWQEKNQGSFYTAYNKKWTKNLSKYFKTNAEDEYWKVFENHIPVALLYDNVTQWKKGNPKSHYIADKNDWIEKLTSHMIKSTYPHGHWNNIDNIIKESLKYNTKKDWRETQQSSYIKARNNKPLFAELTKNMTK